MKHVLIRDHGENYWARLVRSFKAVIRSRETEQNYNNGKPLPCIEVEPLGSTWREVYMAPGQGGFVLSLFLADDPPVYELVNIGRDWYAVRVEEV